ncbi:MAG TPA: folate-binding protein [Methylotenera sp.]
MSTQQWHDFLQTSAEKNPVSAISPALINETVICDLSHLGLLQLGGADALSFLQGQVTNDVKQLNGQIAHYSGYCNPKGRLLALFLAFAHKDHIHLQLPTELIAPIAKRLKMYVMRSKVEVQDVSESIIKIGVNGPKAIELLSPLFSQTPQNDYKLVSLENGALIKLPGTQPRFEIFTDIANAPAIWNSLAQHTKIADAAYWELLEIQAGIPEVYVKTQEEFVPQMLNLDLLNGINFKKGCYTGQEIVARTHYLGTVKRRTQLAHINGEKQPNAGDDVLNSNGDIIGKVVRCAPSFNGGYDLLVEVRLESVEAGQLNVNGSTLNLQQLPYKI